MLARYAEQTRSLCSVDHVVEINGRDVANRSDRVQLHRSNLVSGRRLIFRFWSCSLIH